MVFALSYELLSILIWSFTITSRLRLTSMQYKSKRKNISFEIINIILYKHDYPKHVYCTYMTITNEKKSLTWAGTLNLDSRFKCYHSFTQPRSKFEFFVICPIDLQSSKSKKTLILKCKFKSRSTQKRVFNLLDRPAKHWFKVAFHLLDYRNITCYTLCKI